jgi:hypothetical protein
LGFERQFVETESHELLTSQSCLIMRKHEFCRECLLKLIVLFE